MLIILLSLSTFFNGNSQTITNVGTDFWIAFPPNVTLQATIEVYISSNFNTSGNVYSAFPSVNQSFTVIPGVVTQLTLPSNVVLHGGIENKGIRITANDPISVYGLNNKIYSTDAFLALPVNALGLDYRIITYKTTYASIDSLGSCFSVVATKDGTALTIFNHQTNSTSYINLDMGQTYHVRATVNSQDLTGSRVQSNFPVAVFGSVDIGYIPSSSCMAPDHIVEQMFPYYSWGKNFLTVPLAGRDGSGDIFRIVAAEDGTGISINGSNVSILNSGDYYETNLSGNNYITTTKAVLLAQYAKGMYCTGSITGDPFMMLIPPMEQFLTNYTIISVAGVSNAFTSHWVNVVAPEAAIGSIYQDGVLIPGGAFTQISTTNYYGAQRSVIVGSHTFSSTFPFGVFVYGWGLTDSYGYPGGCSLSPVGTVNSVTLSPDTAYGQLNVTNVCLTANVMDNLLNPVVGVLVNFYVSGINPLTGNAYTDALGNAQYCYTQTGVTPGEDHVYAEVFGFISDTSVVFWSYTPPCSNPTNGGTIGNDQSGCGSYLPTPLNNLQTPSGFFGNLEYKWRLSTTSNTTGFSDIAASNSSSYNPGLITQTTWFKRVARVDCMSDWNGAVESNVIEITVIPPEIVSVIISGLNDTVCAGTQVTYSATPTNGGTTPAYQWQVNGGGVFPNAATMSYSPANGDIVNCILTSSNTVCISNNPATSNAITMVVNSLNPVSVTISTPDNPFCQGSTVTFTATPTNGGTTPTYSWKVNGVGVGTNNPIYSYVPANGDFVTCVMNSNIACPTGNPANSNTITMVENTVNPVSIVITTPVTIVCSGTSVIFTATPTNGGTTPGYQWKVNGVNTGANNSQFTYTPVNGDCISCILTSNLVCASGNPATSNSICMTVNPNLPVSISISTPVTTVCAGTQVTFTASPTNQGTLPQFQWKVNGVGVGTSILSYSYIPLNGDQVTCILTSNATCPTGNPATSNMIAMTVNANMPVSVLISASNNPVCSGISVIYTANPTNGGTTPVYLWKVNGINSGTNSPTYQYIPLNNDQISCTLTSNLTCTSGNPATSNTITMGVAASPIVTLTRCNDSVTTTAAQPFRLKGGIPLGGTYSGPGVTNGIFYPAIGGVGTHQITYTYTNVALCSANAFVTIVTRNASPVTCGNPLTDIRDNKVYPTVQIGVQCWMATNLNYGNAIPETQNQRDNCIPEKYSGPMSQVPSPAFYQWDELMQYDETLSTQGLCPPGWHVPAESDWNTLYTVYINSAFAAWPLLYTGYSGFNATLSGVRHMNTTWDWNGFATFFWSSTTHGSIKAWSHGMNSFDPSVSAYPALRSNAFSVRCLKD
ncbi:MAG: hypothetical protein NTX61_04290 [Bacteroidetes bacterium]|nr:hypothetical protein [Bacteroidota bacterium]